MAHGEWRRPGLALWIVGIVAIALVLGACPSNGAGADSSNQPGGPGIAAGNGRGVITGGTFGRQETTNDNLRKVISAELVSGSDPRLEIAGPVYATRITETSESLYLIVPLRNGSDDALFGIDIDDLFLLDTDGNPTHANEQLAVFHGTVAQSDLGFHSNDGLAPGETGYVLLIEIDEYPVTEGVRLMATVTDEPFVPNGFLRPDSYAVQDGGSTDGIVVSATNTGNVAVDVWSFVYWIGYGPNGNPVTWGLDDQNPIPATGVVQPDETYSVEDTSVFNGGTIASIEVFFRFDSFGATSAVSGDAIPRSIEGETRDERIKRVHEAISAREE